MDNALDLIRKLGVALARQAADDNFEQANFSLFLRPLPDGTWQAEHDGAWLRYSERDPCRVTVYSNGVMRTVTRDLAGRAAMSPELWNIWYAMSPTIRNVA
jgi:hypothetical protein